MVKYTYLDVEMPKGTNTGGDMVEDDHRRVLVAACPVRFAVRGYGDYVKVELWLDPHDADALAQIIKNAETAPYNWADSEEGAEEALLAGEKLEPILLRMPWDRLQHSTPLRVIALLVGAFRGVTIPLPAESLKGLRQQPEG
jgi:hypothetical protein